MKPEDKVVIEVSLRELARVYAVMGRVNGKVGTSPLVWNLARDVLDPDGNKYGSFRIGEIEDICAYYSYQAEWESLFFDDETTRKIKELEATITLAQQQIQELKESK